VKIKLPKNKQVAEPGAVAKIFNDILKAESKLDQQKEHFWVMGLSTSMKIKFIELVHLGGLESTMIDLRTIFRSILFNACSGFIVCHNHPGEKLLASSEDIVATTKIREASDIIVLKFLDHIIVDGKGGYYSLKENNQFDK